MKHFILYLFSTILLFASCKKDSHNIPNKNDSLIGKWKWVQQTDAVSINGTPYDTLTPKNTGISKLLNLNTDSTWSLEQNNRIVLSGTFKFIVEVTPDGLLTSFDFVNNSGVDSVVNHWLLNDTLYMSNILYIDRYTINTYARQN